jgi:hypothetical protein
MLVMVLVEVVHVIFLLGIHHSADQKECYGSILSLIIRSTCASLFIKHLAKCLCYKDKLCLSKEIKKSQMALNFIYQRIEDSY